MSFPATYNFNYYRGDTFQFVIRPKVSNGQSFDLSGYSAAYTIATARGPGSTQYTATATVDTMNDIVTCTISESTGRSLSPDTYVYDVEIGNGLQTYTLLTGFISVVDDVTGAV